MGNTINLEISTNRIDDNTAIVSLQGEMDVYTTPQAKEVMLNLLAEGYHQIIINLTNADYLDSTALGVLVGMLKRVREQSGDLRLVSPPAKIRRLLEITRLVNVFPIDSSEQEAINHFTKKRTES